MPDAAFDVVALGNALVDVISHEDDAFLEAHDLVKGSMALVDEDRADALYAAMGPGTEVSGGSAANTAAGLASFGARTAFIGKVRDDQLGAVFAHDLRTAGVAFSCPAASEGPATGRCLIVVTADAERTMNTFLGAGANIDPAWVDPEVVEAAKVTYLEGYLWDQPAAKDAYRAASRIAREAGGEVALTLSDSFCVERHRDDFVALVEGSVDVLFGNADEVQELYRCDLDAAIQRLQGVVRVAVVTRGAAGSTIVTPDRRIDVPAEPVEQVVDTTGAGDLFAAGFLAGYTSGADLAECGRLAAAAAAEVISHTGARPLAPLAALRGR